MLPIKGQGYLLRTLTLQDAASLAHHANDFAVWINLKDAMPHPYQLSDAEWFINHVADDDPVQKVGIEVDGEVAGVMGINILTDVYHQTADFGYWLGQAHWGKGIVSAAVGQFVAYVFDHFDLHKISAGVYARNSGSIRVLEKNGFQFEGTLKEHVFKNGKFEDECRYGLIRPGMPNTIL